MRRPMYVELVEEAENDERFNELLNKPDLSEEDLETLVTYPSDYMDRMNEYLERLIAKRIVKYHKVYLGETVKFQDVYNEIHCRLRRA